MTKAVPSVWIVEIVRFPLPPAPIGEHVGAGVTLTPPQRFTIRATALIYAGGLAQQGYGLRMSSPEGQVWDHRQIVEHIDRRGA
ncbi:MAG: hypothetical protein ACLQJR_00905 [Stellaceae bacterium]